MGVDCTTYVMLGYKLDTKSTLGKALYDAFDYEGDYGNLTIINDGMSGKYIIIGKLYGEGEAFQTDLFVELDSCSFKNDRALVEEEVKTAFSFGEEIVKNIPIKLLAFHHYN